MKIKRPSKNKNSRNIFLGCVILILGAVMFASIIKTEYIPHRNNIDTEISLYSDKHITPNAIASNPEFQSITFDNSLKTQSAFLSNQLASVIKAVKFLTNASPKENAPEYGSWIWTPTLSMTPAYMQSTITQVKDDGLNVIYLSIDSYLDIFVMPKGAERERQKKAFSQKLEDFIILANNQGIAVDAEAGWQNWAEPGNTYKAFAIINYVKNFNTEHQNKFRGFQYDVEPYLLPSFKKDKTSALKNFVELVDQTENFLSDTDLRFSIVIPDFYDKKDALTPRVWFGSKKDFAFNHLLNILDRRAGNSIIVMSYRNFAEGPDGAIEVSKNEMISADKGFHQTKIIIAQETGDVPPPYITFHNTSKNYFLTEVAKINKTFEKYDNFGGIAIHYANAFLALK